MYSSIFLASAFPALGALALPSALVGAAMNPGGGSNPKHFSIKQVRNERFTEFEGALDLALAYSKYDVKPPADVQAAVSSLIGRPGLDKRATGSVTATPIRLDKEYLCPVSIGNPPQTLNIDFDTGSADFWVYSSETPSGAASGHDIYNMTKSTSSKKLAGATWAIGYADGSSASGNVYRDDVTIGGLTVKGQGVEAAKNVSDILKGRPDTDGMLGLGFGTNNRVSPNKEKTFFENAIGALDKPVFTADLKAGKAGKYDFGFINKASYTGEITYTPVNTSYFWMFRSPAFAIGDTKYSLPMDVIADTGTTLIILPSIVAAAYYSNVPGTQYDAGRAGYVFPCNAVLPSFSFYVEKSKITVPGKYINVYSTDGTMCWSGIQPGDGFGFAILGALALKSAFVVFEGGAKPRIGFASKNL